MMLSRHLLFYYGGKIRNSGFSSDLSSIENNLKSCIHALYKLVHPDLFTQYPKEKAENERSLKLLQDYIRAGKDGQMNTALAPYDFVFFVNIKNKHRLNNEETDENGIEKVSLMLPPPIRNSPPGNTFSPTMLMALQKLMKAVGLPKDLIEKLNVSTNHNHLELFLVEAAEHTRYNETNIMSDEKILENAKLIIHIGKKVSIGFGEACENMTTKNKIKLIEDLAWALDRIGNLDLTGHRIMFGSDEGIIDGNGCFWLNYKESKQQWLLDILIADTIAMSHKKEQVAKIKLKEKELSVKLGISMIYTSGDLIHTPAYNYLLDNLTQMMANMQSNQSNKSDFSKIPICIISQDYNKHNCLIDEEYGFIKAPISINPVDLYKFLEDNWNKALDKILKFEKEKKDLNEYTEITRKLLKIRRLIKDPKITNDQYRKCCYRLCKHKDEIMKWTDGISIRISDKNCIYKDKLFIDVSHNFII